MCNVEQQSGSKSTPMGPARVRSALASSWQKDAEWATRLRGLIPTYTQEATPQIKATDPMKLTQIPLPQWASFDRDSSLQSWHLVTLPPDSLELAQVSAQ